MENMFKVCLLGLLVVNYIPGTSQAHFKRSLSSSSVTLHFLHPRTFLHVNWSPIITYIFFLMIHNLYTRRMYHVYYDIQILYM